MIRGVDHIGIAVPNLDEATAWYRRVLDAPSVQRIDSPGQHVNASLIPVGQTDIELIQPITADSGVARFLARRGTALHHICLDVEDVGAELQRLKALGASLIDTEPRRPDGGPFRQFAWVHQSTLGGVLLELVERVR